jgi:hypothetical protein
MPIKTISAIITKKVHLADLKVNEMATSEDAVWVRDTVGVKMAGDKDMVEDKGSVVGETLSMQTKTEFATIMSRLQKNNRLI